MLCTSVWPELGHAHAFGARYDLPLPLWLYLVAAGATVAFTFLLLALFCRDKSDKGPEWTMPITWSRVLALMPVRICGQAAGIFIFLLVVLTGLFGSQDTIHNLAPALVWVIWWVGFTFFACLAINLWPFVNPWTALFKAFAWLRGRWRISAPSRSLLTYPPALGAWPSVLFLFLVAWLEQVSTIGERPRALACVILLYSGLTWMGMWFFGRDKWLASGEVFHQYFGVLGRFAPVGTCDGRIVLRPYGAGLRATQPAHPSMTLFVIVMLATVTFDGFVETPAWAGLLQWVSESRLLRGALIWFQSVGVELLGLIKTIAFIFCIALFFAVFRGFCTLSRLLTGGTVTIFLLTNTLVFSLVPIAIAYHVAHYLSYLLLAGQLIIPLASDPFGWGWDLFGTASYSMDIGIINAATVWYVAVGAIVLGHVIAVWVAHEIALALYVNSRHALLSQLPMLVLMVLYTMSSLWILSQPIIEI
ncbi:MAG: hypothetical protein VX871_04755 [Pseudomonadota bacterium]|nr:hypothetical protein [Pseudomonadota bacterium]